MKLVCSKEYLLNGLQIASKAVPAKTTMSILECLLIDAKGDNITLTANNMELGIQTMIEGEIREKGIIALDARILLDIVKNLPDSFITIETDKDDKAVITCEKSRYVIMGKSGEDFSVLPSFEHTENMIKLSQYSLKEAIRQTIFSISDSDTNKMMTGELFKKQRDCLNISSLDGFRISIRNLNIESDNNDFEVIIPGKTLNELSKIISGDTDKDIFIYVPTHNHVLFEFDRTVVVSRLIEGKYFNVDQMLTKDYETKVTINKKEMLNSINRSTILMKEGDRKQPIIINITDDRMEIRMNCAVGSMNEEIDIAKKGQDMIIGFNPKYLIDVLRVIDDEEIDIYFVNPKAPCFIRDKEESYTYVVLPLNFNTIS